MNSDTLNQIKLLDKEFDELSKNIANEYTISDIERMSDILDTREKLLSKLDGSTR